MINSVYKLVGTKNIQLFHQSEKLEKNDIIIRPLYLAICAADQRYYTGKRDEKIMKEKLPMALIHEAVGEVLYDPSKELKKGTKVVMIPNTPVSTSEYYKENYLTNSKFKSSSTDGFMQSFVKIKKDRVIVLNDKIDIQTASLCEIMSVAINAIEEFKQKSINKKDVFGVWGDGSIGYVTALLLKEEYPTSKVIIFGNNETKLNYFSFCDKKINIKYTENLEKLEIDHAFECVGGSATEVVLKDIIKLINPQGTISLLGVSEQSIPIETRMVLEKGLTLIGHSRSSYDDFYKATQYLKNEKIESYMENIISEKVQVNSIDDMHSAFENDINNEFKTIMKWDI